MFPLTSFSTILTPMLQTSALLALLLIFFFIATVFFILWQDARNKNLRLHGQFKPYQRKKHFLTPSEQQLFQLLQQLEVLQRYYVFPQLHLSTLLRVKADAKDLMGKFEYINKLYVDFVIFDQHFQPVLAIELNDPSHFWGARKSRDEFVEQALRDVGVPLLTLTTQDLRSPVEVGEKVERGLGS